MKKSESRRKFLKTTGKFAVYTPPALLILKGADVQAMGRSCNNGFGNGDQCAPGNSLPNNNAENSLTGNPNHPGNPN